MPLTLTTAPTTEPVAIPELKEWLGYGADDQDNIFAELLRAARMHVEHITWRQLVTATYTLKLDTFPRVIYLPRSPLQSVTSIQYVDHDGNTQTLATANYQISGTEPAEIVEAYNVTWPITRDIKDAVTITYTSGYGVGHTIPEPLRHAILMIASGWWQAISCGQHSSERIPMAAKAMLEPYELHDLRTLQGV